MGKCCNPVPGPWKYVELSIFVMIDKRNNDFAQVLGGRIMSPLFFKIKKTCIVSTFISISLFKYLIYKYSQNVPFLSNNLKQIVWKYYYSCGTHFCWISGGLKLHNLKSNEIHFHWFNTIYSRAQWSLSGFDTNSVIVVQCPPNFIEDCLKLCNE
jgi:hypothetical protein